MLKYIVKRLLLSVVILFGVSVIIYFLLRLLPDDFVTVKFNAALSQGLVKEEDIARIKELYGIADNSFFGIIKGYFKWIGAALTGDLGVSFLKGRPVTEVIAQNMGVSFAFALVAEIFRYLIAIPLGIHTARKQYGASDYTITTATMIGISLPSFFLAAIVIKVFSYDLGWLPSSGLNDATIVNPTFFQRIGDSAVHLILPVFVIVVLGIGGLMRYTRSNTIEVINADYIRTARAKGLSERRVIYKHAFRNTLIPIVTLLAGTLPSLFGGAMILENVFAIPGIGYIAYQSLMIGDIPFVMGYNMFLAVLTIIGTLFSDLMYAVVDPRIKITR